MAVKVQFKDNSFGSVPDRALDELIADGSVIAFRREDGWVEIGKDPLREISASKEYDGEDRRGATVRNCLTCPEFVNSRCTSTTCPYRFSLQGKSL